MESRRWCGVFVLRCGGDMMDHLRMFLVHAVADHAADYRPGARHALMLYATAHSIEAAQHRARDFAAAKGWSHIEFRRGKEINSDPDLIEDDTLRSAAAKALQSGAALVVYADEIPVDA